MRICFVAPFGIRPKGTVPARMIPLAEALQARGHQVVVVAPPYTNPEDSGRCERVRGVELRNIRLAPGGKVLATPLMAWRMLRGIRQTQPELVHLFKPKGYGALAVMLQLVVQRELPIFVDSDDWEGCGGMNALHGYGRVEQCLYSFQEQWLSRHAWGVTLASRALQEMTGQMGVPQRQMLYLPNGVEPRPSGDGDRIRAALGMTPDQPVLLLYTRFFEFSQQPLYRLFQGMTATMPNLRILVVGQGRRGEDAALLQAAQEFGFSQALHHAGWVEPEHLPDWFAAAQVALYPFDDTLTNRTKCPAKLTELLLAGLPVVGHAVGQVRDYLSATPELLCEPGDWGALQQKLLLLLQDRTLADLTGQRLRQDILSRFAWSDEAEKLERFYRAMCRRGESS